MRITVLLALLIVPACGQLVLNNFIASHMVLARQPIAARVWGNTAPGSIVSVTLVGGGSWKAAAATADGSWQLDLPPQPAGANHSLTFSDGSTVVTLHDIAFGDVFLCSGQSNMEFSLNAAMNASAEIADSINYPNLRLATVATQLSATPMSNAPSIANYTGPDGKVEAWRRSEPDAFAPATTTQFSYFSAVCYLYGRDLYKSLGGAVPIGLIASDVGGVKIETLMSTDALTDSSCGGTAYVPRTTAEQLTPEIPQVTRDVELAAGPNRELELGAGSGDLWNGMITPLLPMRFAGVIFYQGESNSLAGCPQAYSCLFPALITDWRRKFDQPDLGFFFVQLAAYGWHDYTHTRQAQLAALELPNVAMASAIDLGDMQSPNGGIHPRLKQEVGRRLALAARAVLYLEVGVVYEGPRLSGVYLSNTEANVVTLTFDVSTAHNLHLSGTNGCHDCCATPHTQPWYAAFETQAPNGTWLPSINATVHRNTVVVSSMVPISGVQAGYGGMPDCLLYNGDGGANDHGGIVAPPFRRCLYGATAGLPSWNWRSDCNPAPLGELYPSPNGSIVPSSSITDFILGNTATMLGGADASSSGKWLVSGKPKGAASFVSRHQIACNGGDVVDSVELNFRYRASNVSGSNKPAVMTVVLVNADTKPVATVGDGITLGNYSAPDGFSPPVHVSGSNLKAACDGGIGANPRGRLLIQLAITNNDCPVIIPLDDKVGGFDIRVRWVKA